MELPFIDCGTQMNNNIIVRTCLFFCFFLCLDPPAMLEILRNGRNLSINPLPQQNGIIYNPTSYSGISDVILDVSTNGSTAIFVEDVDSAFNLTFNCVNGAEHFIIG